MENKSKINPLIIKDANWVLANVVCNALILFFLSTKMEESGCSRFLINLTVCCQFLCILVGLVICAGWIVAVATKNVIYMEPSKDKKGNNNGNDSNKR